MLENVPRVKTFFAAFVICITTENKLENVIILALEPPDSMVCGGDMHCSAAESHQHCWHEPCQNKNIKHCCHCDLWQIEADGRVIPLPRSSNNAYLVSRLHLSLIRERAVFFAFCLRQGAIRAFIAL